MSSRVGIYAGTFDPVHNGHVQFCLAAIEAGNLERVILLPEAEPREKTGVTILAHRIAMLQLAVQPYPKLEVMQLPDKQFNIQRTLLELQRRLHGSELVMLMGSDVVRTFPHRWPGLEKLLKTTPLIIGLRQGGSREEVEGTMRQLEEDYSIEVRYQCILGPNFHLASQQVRSGLIGDVPPEAKKYIVQHRLYGTNATMYVDDEGSAGH